MLVIKNLCKNFKDKEVIKNANLTLSNKGLYFILGDSGCGKTTLFNILQTNDKEYNGSIQIDNQDLKIICSDLLNFKFNYVSTIYQDFKLLSGYTVNQILFTVQRMIHKTQSDVNEVLETVGLLDKKDVIVDKLSGGEKQRVAIARSLLISPKILLADEPTGSLDSENADNIISLLEEISKTRLVIVITHDSDLAKDKKNIIYFQNKTFNYSCKEKIENSLKESVNRVKSKSRLKISFFNFKAFWGRIVLMNLIIGFGLGFFISSLFMSSLADDSIKSFIESNSNLTNIFINQKDINADFNFKENDKITDYYYTYEIDKTVIKKDQSSVALTYKKHRPLAVQSLLSGSFPSQIDEIVLSPTLAKKLYPRSFDLIGETIHFEVYNQEDEKVERVLKVVGIMNYEYDDYILNNAFEKEIYGICNHKLTGLNLVVSSYENILEISKILDGFKIKFISSIGEIESLTQTFSNLKLIFFILSILIFIVALTSSLIMFMRYYLSRKKYNLVFKSIGYNKKEINLILLNEITMFVCQFVFSTAVFAGLFSFIAKLIFGAII